MFTRNSRSEVDIRIAQELKNHNDWMYDTNQSIQALKKSHEAIDNQNEKLVAKSESQVNAVMIQFENFKNEMASTQKANHERFSKLEKTVLDSFIQLKKVAEIVKEDFVTKEEFSDSIKDKSKQIISIENHISNRDEYIDSMFNRIKSQFNCSLEALRMDLTRVIPEIDPVKKKMDEQFAIFKVDFDGLVQEINLLKKADAYDQKKFENIYTLIERLKERIS